MHAPPPPNSHSHYGGAWYRQKMDFSYFPGAVLATTNCVLEPMALYRNNLFTTNEVRGGGRGLVASRQGARPCNCGAETMW